MPRILFDNANYRGLHEGTSEHAFLRRVGAWNTHQAKLRARRIDRWAKNVCARERDRQRNQIGVGRGQAEEGR